MTRWLAQRLLMLVPVLFGVSVIVFLTMAMVPGDPALAILGPYATPERIEAIRASMGLDQPLPVQYAIWIGDVLQGDFGRAYSLERPVLAEIGDRLGPTLLLAGAALVLSVGVGALVGSLAAVWAGRWPDRMLTSATLIGLAIPPFWLGLMLVLLFAVRLGWFPVSGMAAVYGGGGWLDVARHMVLPTLTLAAVGAAVIARFARTGVLEVLHDDYIRTARGKGAPERIVLWRHAFRNALVRLLPVIGTQVGYLLGGTVYVETVFQWPGVGRMLVDAILSRDLLLVQGTVLVVATLYVLLNLAVDTGQRLLDPRIRS